MIKLIKSKKGESLTEILLAILILGMAITALFTMITIARRMNAAAAATDTKAFGEITNIAEKNATKSDKFILVDGQNINIDYYVTNEGSVFYRSKDE